MEARLAGAFQEVLREGVEAPSLFDYSSVGKNWNRDFS